ncbi:hypothetical protein PZE06_28990, partial [Robertmurraya sp. DFI.2.37]|uniref:hypothetical protein n=1 Tax=Robertmurraya sp. DFI.2.37 TaxID=3031819 RepID=UPI0023DBA1DC
KTRKKGKKKKKNVHLSQSTKHSVSYVCLVCHEKEEIPINVVIDFDMMDEGDPTTPTMFSCEKCGGEMYPEYYKGVHGIEYKISDIR